MKVNILYCVEKLFHFIWTINRLHCKLTAIIFNKVLFVVIAKMLLTPKLVHTDIKWQQGRKTGQHDHLLTKAIKLLVKGRWPQMIP